MTTECDCNNCQVRRKLEAEGKLPKGMCPEELDRKIRGALTQITISTVGADPDGFRTAILICVDKLAGRELPVIGIYKIEDGGGVCWIPMFAYINEHLRDFPVKGEEALGSVMTRAEYLLMRSPTKGEPS